MGEASAFKSGREFSTHVGLGPKQTGPEGKSRLLWIDKRVQTLFIQWSKRSSCLWP